MSKVKSIIVEIEKEDVSDLMKYMLRSIVNKDALHDNEKEVFNAILTIFDETENETLLNLVYNYRKDRLR